jgi:hypothetical protein
MDPMELSATGMRGGAHPQPPAATETSPRPAPASRDSRSLIDTSIGVERTAWFDLNGDGKISNRSSLLGGDGYLIGDGNLDGRLARGSETWYDAHGRPVPPPPPGAGEVSSPPPATPPPQPERARETAAQTYSQN